MVPDMAESMQLTGMLAACVAVELWALCAQAEAASYAALAVALDA